MHKSSFSTFTYPSEHWALQKFDLANESNLVAIFGKNGEQNKGFAFFLNPTDSRGYRSIVRMFNNDLMESTFNRSFTLDDQLALGQCLQIASFIYQKVVPISQVFILGNNSHSFNESNRSITIGTKNEPNFLHGHIVGRGDPEHDYIQGVPLLGPIPGESFDLVHGKQKWKSEADVMKVVKSFKGLLNQLNYSESIQKILKQNDLKLFIV